MRTTIHYIIGIPNPTSDNQTPFQAFSPEVLSTTDSLLGLTQLPMNIIEAFCTQEERKQSRIHGTAVLSCHLCYIRSLEKSLPQTWDTPWCVALLPEHIPTEIIRSLERHTPRPLVLAHDFSSLWQTQQSDLSRIRSTIQSWALSRLDECAKRGSKIAESLRTSARKKQALDKQRTLKLTRRSHNVTLPSELALQSVGFRFKKHNPFPPISLEETNSDSHTSAMLELANKIFHERERALASSLRSTVPPALDLIVSVPTMRHDMHTGRRLWSQSIDENEPELARQAGRVLKIIGQQDGAKYNLQPSEFKDLISPVGQFLIETRKAELSMLSAAIAIKATEQFCPAIRLPPTLNKIRPILNGMARCALGKSPHKRAKLNTMAKRVADEFSSNVPPTLRTALSRARTHLKFVGDLPLELARCERLGIALSISTPVSRVPTLPGDLAVQQLASNTEVLVPASTLRDVLILRSFSEDDNLRGLMEQTARATLGERFGKISITDVDSIEDAEAAINRFKGAVVIFDMHGRVEGDTSTLSIGNDEWDIASSRDRIRLPPVVIFSACNTAPIDRGTASVASAALLAGAKVVVGTLLPVNGAESAVLVSRLLLRLFDYIPAAHGAFKRVLRWTEIFGGMMKMSYATDVMRSLLIRNVTQDQFSKDHLALNIAINSEQPSDEWWHQLVSRTAHRLSLEEAEAANIIQERYYFTETCRYAMLGAPEHLIAVPG
ncbi:MAG: CHAT domain-containing protein [Verrucomicrobiaceae bacterium]|nr:MAG: CHAT domain-containing protein [Verrucomicrobiaceae bacterium]